MTVKSAVNRDSLDRSDLQNKTTRATDGEFASPDLADLAGNCSRKEEKAVFREVEMVQERGGTAAGIGRKKVEMVHYQVMRIREEDSLIGGDVADGGLEKIGGRNRHVASSPVFFFRPILPCSPLSGKASQRQGIALN